MSRLYSPEVLNCPHCEYIGLMQWADHRCYEDRLWLFLVCPGCNRFVATDNGDSLTRLDDLPFTPLHLRRPRKA